MKTRSARVVNDHVVKCDPRGFVLFGDATESIEEQTVTELHNISFVDACHFLEKIRKVSMNVRLA